MRTSFARESPMPVTWKVTNRGRGSGPTDRGGGRYRSLETIHGGEARKLRLVRGDRSDGEAASVFSANYSCNPPDERFRQAAAGVRENVDATFFRTNDFVFLDNQRNSRREESSFLWGLHHRCIGKHVVAITSIEIPRHWVVDRRLLTSDNGSTRFARRECRKVENWARKSIPETGVSSTCHSTGSKRFERVMIK